MGIFNALNFDPTIRNAGKKKKKKPSDLIALNDHPRLFFFKAMGIHQKPLHTTTIENKIFVYIYMIKEEKKVVVVVVVVKGGVE